MTLRSVAETSSSSPPGTNVKTKSCHPPFQRSVTAAAKKFHKRNPKLKICATLAAGALIISAHAAPTFLWLRNEPNSAIPQTVEPTPGTNSLSLPFSGTVTYDFFSPPLTSSISLTTAAKGGGVIYMRNTSSTTANDFGVSGRMQYFDYDPTTGIDTLIVDTGPSGQKNVNHGQTVNWAIPNALLPVARTVPAGHLVHVAVTIGLLSGNPGAFGSLVYNASSGTQALFPQNQTIGFPFGPLTPPAPPSIVGSPVPGGGFNITLTGAPGASYAIQATTNLSNPVWVTLVTTNANSSGLVLFKDPDAPIYPCRFYRTAQ
jgi:hypothetical protein